MPRPKEIMRISTKLTIGITTTAVCRPEILEKTYASFFKNTKNIDLSNCKLYINIDNMPLFKDAQEVIAVAKKYFKKVKYNISDEPHFTKAVHWCWDNASEDIILHLEDDWILTESINFNEIKETMLTRNIVQVALRAYKNKYKGMMVLSPSFIKKKIYKKIVRKMDFRKNPELQLRDYQRYPFLLNPTGFVVYSKGIVLKDIGKQWIEKTNYTKPIEKKKFIKWTELADDFFHGINI